jgi:hypothetical protein
VDVLRLCQDSFCCQHLKGRQRSYTVWKFSVELASNKSASNERADCIILFTSLKTLQLDALRGGEAEKGWM